MSLLRLSLFLTLLVAVVYAATLYDEKRDAPQPPLSALQSSSSAVDIRMSTSSAFSDNPSRLRYPCTLTACNSFCQALGWCAGFCRSLEVCRCFC